MRSQWLALVKQLVFGVDTTSAIMLCAVLGMIFNPHPGFLPAVGYLLLAGFGNYLPDLDMVPYLLLRKRFGWRCHWDVGGHYPLIVLPLVGILTFLVARTTNIDNPIFATILVLACTFTHFVHDSTALPGFPWLSPFKKNVHMTLFYGWPRIITDAAFLEDLKRLNERLEKASIDEALAAHGEPTTVWHFIAWIVAVGMFCYWVAM